MGERISKVKKKEKRGLEKTRNDRRTSSNRNDGRHDRENNPNLEDGESGSDSTEHHRGQSGSPSSTDVGNHNNNESTRQAVQRQLPPIPNPFHMDQPDPGEVELGPREDIASAAGRTESAAAYYRRPTASKHTNFAECSKASDSKLSQTSGPTFYLNEKFQSEGQRANRHEFTFGTAFLTDETLNARGYFVTSFLDSLESSDPTYMRIETEKEEDSNLYRTGMIRGEPIYGETNYGGGLYQMSSVNNEIKTGNAGGMELTFADNSRYVASGSDDSSTLLKVPFDSHPKICSERDFGFTEAKEVNPSEYTEAKEVIASESADRLCHAQDAEYTGDYVPSYLHVFQNDVQKQPIPVLPPVAEGNENGGQSRYWNVQPAAEDLQTSRVLANRNTSQERSYLEEETQMKALLLVKSDFNNQSCTVHLRLLLGVNEQKIKDRLGRLRLTGFYEVLYDTEFPVCRGYPSSKITVKISDIQWIPEGAITHEGKLEQTIGLDRLWTGIAVDSWFWQRSCSVKEDELQFAATCQIQQDEFQEIQFHILCNLKELSPRGIGPTCTYARDCSSPTTVKNDTEQQENSSGSKAIELDLHADWSCPDAKSGSSEEIQSKKMTSLEISNEIRPRAFS